MITKPRLIFVGLLALWVALTAGVLHVAGRTTTACGAVDPGVAKPAACDYYIEFFTWALLAYVIIGGARAIKRLATKLGITID